MLPRRIYLKDFMGHKESDIDCTKFNSCLIVGKNKNNAHISNGVGKSTIFKAIEFVLYGEYACDKIEEIIRNDQELCRVIFEFELDNEIYQVIRQRSKSGTHIYLNIWKADKWESLTSKTNTQTELELNKLIKISHKALKNSIYFDQGNLDGIPSASNDKRKELLKEPLNITIYNKHHKIAKKKLDEQENNLDKLKFKIDSLGNPEKELNSCLLDISAISIKLVDNRRLYEELQKKIDNKKSQLSDLDRLISSESVDVNKQLIETKDRLKEIESELLRTTSEQTVASKKMQEFKQELAEKISALQSKTDHLKKLKTEELRATNTIQNELTLIIEKEQRGRVAIARLEVDESRYSKPIADIGECSFCQQEVKEDHRVKCLEESGKKLIDVRQDLIKYREAMTKCLTKRRNLEVEQKETVKKLSQIDSFELEIGNWKNNINKIQELVNQYNSTIDNKNNDLSRLNISKENLSSRYSILLESAKKFNIKELNEKMSLIKIEIQDLDLNIKKCLSDISSDDTRVGILKEKEDNFKNNIIKLQKFSEEEKVILEKVGLLKKVVIAFGNHGIPTLIINTILNNLSIEANLLLQSLRPSLSFQFKYDESNEDILDIVYYKHNKEISYKLISGGEKLMVNLSFKLALSKIIQKRLGVDIKFLLLDEIDQSLDQSGVADLAQLIKKLQESFKVFSVTHNRNLADEFSQFIIVSGDDENGSVAKYSTTWDN